MLTRRLYRQLLSNLTCQTTCSLRRQLCLSRRSSAPKRHPDVQDVKDPIRVLREEIQSWRKSSQFEDGLVEIPREVEVLIIGDGIAAQAAAYFAKQVEPTIRIVIVSSGNSPPSGVLHLRHQWSLPEYVELSRFAAEFLQSSRDILSVDGLPKVVVPFTPTPSLLLADEERAPFLLAAHALQESEGADVELLSREALARRFPFIDTSGVEVASLGNIDNGQIDATALYNAFKLAVQVYKVRLVTGKLSHFEFERQPGVRQKDGFNRNLIRNTMIETPDGDLWPIKSTRIVIANDMGAGDVADMLHLGDDGPKELSERLPLVAHPRRVFCVHSLNDPGLGMPHIISSDDMFVYRVGHHGHFVCGSTQYENSSMTDEEFFATAIQPQLAARVPSLKGTRLVDSWREREDFNYRDSGIIVGHHPYYQPLHFLCGFGSNPQFCFGAARGLGEMMIHGQYRALDLDQFSFLRFFEESEAPVYDILHTAASADSIELAERDDAARAERNKRLLLHNQS